MRVTKRSVYSGLAGIGIILGAGGLVAAATGPDTTPTSAAVVQQAPPDQTTDTPADDATETDGPETDGQDNDETTPDYTSSVQTTPEVDETTESDAADDAAEADEDAALGALATVTPAEASAAALDAQPGTIDDVELSNENGNVVYEVEVVATDGAEFDVIIDAGNAEVLDIRADDGPYTAADHTSSIQTDPSVDDQADAALVALATVTPEEASAAALAARSGTVTDVELSNEAGNVVYEVEVVDANGAEFDVIIDAGNASVLATEAD